jgi:hypothetical protein
VRSTDGLWQAVEFQTRAKGQHELYKLLRLASCAVYLDPHCETPLVAQAVAAGPNLAASAVGPPMHALIARSSAREDEPTGPGTARGGLHAESYLVAPLTLEVGTLERRIPRLYAHPTLMLTPVPQHREPQSLNWLLVFSRQSNALIWCCRCARAATSARAASGSRPFGSACPCRSR